MTMIAIRSTITDASAVCVCVCDEQKKFITYDIAEIILDVYRTSETSVLQQGIQSCGPTPSLSWCQLTQKNSIMTNANTSRCSELAVLSDLDGEWSLS